MIKVIFRDAMRDHLMTSLVPPGSSLKTSPSSRCMMGLCPASGLTSPQLSSSPPPTSSLACEHPHSARPKAGFITYCRVSSMQVVQRKHAQTLPQAFCDVVSHLGSPVQGKHRLLPHGYTATLPMPGEHHSMLILTDCFQHELAGAVIVGNARQGWRSCFCYIAGTTMQTRQASLGMQPRNAATLGSSMR